MNKTKNKVLQILTALVITILLCVSIAQSVQIKSLTRPEKQIEGTYATANLPGAKYIVLERDNVCGSYMQFEPVETGTYQRDGRTVTMEFSDFTLCAIYADGQLYVFSREDASVIPFEKLSDTPTYINVTQHT